MGQSQPGRFYRVVREHLVEVKGRLSIAAVCTLLLAFADLLRPWPLKLIFDYILFKKPIPHSLSFMHELIAHGTVTAVILISSGIVAIALLKSFAAYSQTHIVSQIGFRSHTHCAARCSFTCRGSRCLSTLACSQASFSPTSLRIRTYSGMPSLSLFLPLSPSSLR